MVSVGEQNEIIVGEAAKERLITKAMRTASCFKRYMGTEKVYDLSGHWFTPEELSSFVLRSLKEEEEAYLCEFDVREPGFEGILVLKKLDKR